MPKKFTRNSVAKTNKTGDLSPEAALRFLEDIRQLAMNRDEPTVPISLRIPANVLRAVKAKAQHEGKKYQSLIIAMICAGLKKP